MQFWYVMKLRCEIWNVDVQIAKTWIEDNFLSFMMMQVCQLFI